MKKVFIAGLTVIGLACSSCSTVPLTGRSRLNLVSDDQVLPMAFQAYTTFLTENKGAVLSASNAQASRVKMIGNKLIAAVKVYMNNNNYGNLIKDYQWEVNVVESKELNAWCMPGGKIVVYTGILPVTKDDAGLATVMGHEIAHAIAGHSAERMSQEMVSQGLGSVGSAALSNNPKTQSLFNTLYGVGTPLVMLKYSRNQELEADKLGLIFMAMAGYNPQNATAFWQRMATASAGSQKPAEFLSTHPSDATRIAQIQRDIPEAMKYYKP
ncbi:MAG: M48 family metallopeptidase [Candidatus Pedobacter colombiensis]|uniref:M48 family metallopeptidase n=1 Tax=Candidatus Pedobacter colombiensis TaxID=3121371 RepID=A0AAJ6B8B2_9SPHI|nr:M48 family metallopeptidase [Pedobacter sp.]WEK20326.1 MAG: M48 family metallopeptidase [Pedobacter sp.]